jgi:hypothetical protein
LNTRFHSHFTAPDLHQSIQPRIHPSFERFVRCSRVKRPTPRFRFSVTVILNVITHAIPSRSSPIASPPLHRIPKFLHNLPNLPRVLLVRIARALYEFRERVRSNVCAFNRRFYRPQPSFRHRRLLAFARARRKRRRRRRGTAGSASRVKRIRWHRKRRRVINDVMRVASFSILNVSFAHATHSTTTLDGFGRTRGDVRERHGH